MTELSRALFARCRVPLPWSHSATWLVTAAVVAMLNASGAPAATIDWVTVGDPGNAADTTGYGAVGYSYRIGKYEVTNSQYVEFLNAVDPEGTNPNNVYDPVMATDVRGGITRSGTVNGARYTVRANMGDKPANYVSFFEMARLANWLHNGAPVSSGTTNASATAPQNTGAYSIGTATGNTGPYPLRNAGARYWIPTESEWYKAAYYKGGGTNSGYWQYATQVSGTAPIGVGATVVGTGTMSGASPVVSGNFSNFNRSADWGSPTVLDGNLTTVGSSGGPSFYGAFDMGGNVEEYFAFATITTHVGMRGGSYRSTSATTLSATVRDTTSVSARNDFRGFRLASSPVPEMDPAGLGSVLALVTGTLGLLERCRKRAA